MPASTKVFADVAARFGDVDPHDLDAVRRWYETKMPTLPPEQIDEILDELLQKEGTRVHSLPRCYPPEVLLPTLDEAPPAPLPLFFVALLALLRRGDRYEVRRAPVERLAYYPGNRLQKGASMNDQAASMGDKQTD